MPTAFPWMSADALKPGLETLPDLTLGLGLVLLALCVPGAVAPAWTARRWRAYPRSVWPGRVLAAVALLWAALWLQGMPLGPLTPLKRFLPLLTPAAIVAVWLWVDELLSCRALGGVMVLIPTPLLSAAQWHPSPWRFVILLCAYALAVGGMILLALPYRGRDALFWAARTPGRLRLLASLKAVFGLFLVVLALTAFQTP